MRREEYPWARIPAGVHCAVCKRPARVHTRQMYEACVEAAAVNRRWASEDIPLKVWDPRILNCRGNEKPGVLWSQALLLAGVAAIAEAAGDNGALFCLQAVGYLRPEDFGIVVHVDLHGAVATE